MSGVSEVADEQEIRALVERYSDAVMRRDADDWARTWAEDCRWIVGGGPPVEGRVVATAQWETLMAMFEFVFQMPQHGVVELDGDRATGRWQVHELGRPRGASASLTIGVYHDTYVRHEGGWLFGERRFEIVYAGPPDLSGVYLGG